MLIEQEDRPAVFARIVTKIPQEYFLQFLPQLRPRCRALAQLAGLVAAVVRHWAPLSIVRPWLPAGVMPGLQHPFVSTPGSGLMLLPMLEPAGLFPVCR